MDDINNKPSITKNLSNNNILTKSSEEINKGKSIQYPNLKPANISPQKIDDAKSNPLLSKKLPPIKPSLINRKTSTSDNACRKNNLLTIKVPAINNNSSKLVSNYCATVDTNQNKLVYNRYNSSFKSQLNIIKDENEKVSSSPVSNIHSRNLELIKRLVEKRKKDMELKFELNRPAKNSMERLDLFKKSLINNGITLIQHKKLEPINDPKNIDDKIIYYYQIIHEGNSSEVIEECLKRRGHWKKYNPDEIHTNNPTTNTSNNGSFIDNNNNNNVKENNYLHFLWSHCSSRIDFNEFSRGKSANFKKMTNHFEDHKEITNKLNLFLNMMIFCENNNYDLFSMLPVTFPIKYESKLYLVKMSSFMYIFNNITKFISDKHLDYKYRNLFELETNGRVGKRTSFHIPENHYSGRNLWLVKAIDLNRGRCIKISDDIKDIENIIKNFYRGVKKDFDKEEKLEEIKEENKLELPVLTNNNIRVNSSGNVYDNKESIIQKKLNIKKNKKINIKVTNPNKNQSPKNLRENILNTYKQYKLYLNDPNTYQNSSVIIQKYIEKPLCYRGRKCDMRVWVLLTWDFNVYLFKEGHFKATSMPYDVDSHNSYVHLTNYSVQKYNKDFSKYEMGNEISFRDFELSVDNAINVKKDLLPKVKEIIICTMKCVKHKINKSDRRLCFEIFGYDFMFDINYKPYLLEINTNPGLEISSPLIEMLIPRLIDDAFKLTIDKVFLISPNNLENMKKNPFKVGGYDDEENMWEFLGNVQN
jgi:hypothetical protein